MTVIHDIIIRNGRVVDGTGNPWFINDIAIDQGKIVALGNLKGVSATFEYNAHHKLVSPGFVDIHTHGDDGVTAFPLMENYLQQGVTSLFGGNCGYSRYPIDIHLQTVEKEALGINYGLFVGQGTIRQQAMGATMRDASDDELDEMCRLTAQAFEQGAWGISLGLYYAPGSYTNRKELIALAEVAARHRRLIVVHLRDESDYNVGLVASIKEVIELASVTGAAVHISHLKCLGSPVWGKAREILGLIENARQAGLDVTFDQYPYLASGTSITGALVPRWAQDGGSIALTQRLQDDVLQKRIREEMADNIARRGGPQTLSISVFKSQPELERKTLAEVGVLWDKEPVDVAIDMQLDGGASLVSFNMAEDDVEIIMRHPLGMFASDGRITQLGHGVPHPRYYGTFPRVLGRYVRGKGVIALEEAIRKMTAAPARRVGLWHKGLIAPGMDADIVVFDEASILDKSTFDSPHKYNQGLHLVVVNGKVVFKEGEVTLERPGMVLRAPWYGNDTKN